MILNQKLLLTGRARSIGKALILRLLNRNQVVLRVLDSSEPGLAELQAQFNDDRLRYLAGNVRDSDRVRWAIEGIEVVIHTAAMKHVDIFGYNPFKTLK
jgi:UDP-N-acetylglucosamine 4,6-dehydratase